MGKMCKFAANATEYFTMKNYAKPALISIIGIFILTLAGCNKYPPGPKIPLYSYLKPIINPPDTFQIAYNAFMAIKLLTFPFRIMLYGLWRSWGWGKLFLKQ